MPKCLRITSKSCDVDTPANVPSAHAKRWHQDRMMKRRLKTQPATTAPAVPEEQLYVQVRHVLAHARGLAHRSVNQAMVQAYWQVGRLIVEHEQAGQARAAYGARQLEALGQRLTQEFGRGFSAANLRNFRQFFQTYGWTEICDMPCRELSWSHLRRLMRVADPQARAWYAAEAVSQTWSFAALDRQISTLHYERVLSSQDKAALQAEAAALVQRDTPPDPRDFIRDPYVLGLSGRTARRGAL